MSDKDNEEFGSRDSRNMLDMALFFTGVVVGVVLGFVLGMIQGQKNGRYYEQLTAVKEQRAFWKPNDMGEPEIFYIIPQKCSHCGQIPEKK